MSNAGQSVLFRNWGHWELFRHYGLGIGHSPFTVASLSAFAKQNGGQSARRRASFSNSAGDGMQQPSRFLAEIPSDLLNQ
jgi:hypothetical protein